MRTAFVVVSTLTVALASGGPTVASDLDGAFWLKQYEHADPMWNSVANAYVLGVLDGAGTFGGIRCPAPVSPRTMAAMTADVIKQRPNNEPALNAVVMAAARLRCLVDTGLIDRAADALKKDKKP